MASKKLWRHGAIATAAFALVLAEPAVAHAADDPVPISPNQFFAGVVNGVTGQSRIAVVCDGPIDVVPLGHPLPGQTVAAEQLPTDASPAANDGFTGSAAYSLDVKIGGNQPVTLRRFHATMRIPTTILVPCQGTATVAFVPNPTSRTARTGTVTVTFVS